MSLEQHTYGSNKNAIKFLIKPKREKKINYEIYRMGRILANAIVLKLFLVVKKMIL